MSEYIASHVVLEIPDWVQQKAAASRSMRYTSAEEQMAFILDIATENSESGSGPFAAAIFTDEGELVAVGVNRVVPDAAPIAHAEIMAIATAGQALGTWDIGSVGVYHLVSSTEPCAMCMGAVPWSGVRALKLGARDSDARAAGFDEGNKPDNWVEHLEAIGISVTRDVMRTEAAKVLSDYAANGGAIYNGATDVR